MPTIINHQSSTTTAEGKVRLFWYIFPQVKCRIVSYRIVQHLSSSQSVNLNLQAVLYGGPNRLLFFSVTHLPLSPSHPLIPVVICKPMQQILFSIYLLSFTPAPLPLPYPTHGYPLRIESICGAYLTLPTFHWICAPSYAGTGYLTLAPMRYRAHHPGVPLQGGFAVPVAAKDDTD